MKEKAVVEQVFRNTPGLPIPTLLVFQNGTLQSTNKEDILFTKLHDKTQKQSAMVLLKDQKYLGPIESTDKLTDLYMCVRNKTTNKVRIIPIEEAKLRNNIYNELEKEEKAKMKPEDSVRTLLTEYGGRKAARYAANKQTMEVDISVIKDDLNNTLEESRVSEDGDESVESDKYLDSIRVKYNPDATKLEEIYNVTDVIPEELLNRLNHEAQKIKEINVEDVPIQSPYLRECLKHTLAKEAEGQILRLKMIIYMDALMNLLKTRERSMVKMELSKITEKVENDIRKRFADAQLKGFKRSTFTVEKAMCYFLVLALIISDKYEVTIKTLQDELNTTRQKIIKYGHVVFARPKTNAQVLSLRLPSSVTPLSTGFGRRKRKL